MKTILVPVDFSSVTPDVLAEAGSLAEALRARLVLLHVLTPPVIMSAYSLDRNDLAGQVEKEEQQARQRLEKHAAALRQKGIEVLAEVREGPAVESTLHVADEQAADFIVIGSHGHGAVYDLLVGSTARGVLRQAKQPVLVVPYATHPRAAQTQA